MDFQSYLINSATEVEKNLEYFFKIWRKEAEKVSSHLLPLVDITIEACKGGKRIRGVLVKLGYELANKKPNPDILKVAAAFEIFQTAILAHDDVIDESPLRRGKPTIYKALGGDHYGISQAICLGDVGFFQAMEIISQTNFPEKNKIKALESFSRTMMETALGEILDVEVPHLKTERMEQDVLTIARFKTARYTISGPLLLGAILGGGDEKLLKKLKEFGDNLGIAFQIQDDILGVFGKESEIGKSVSSDIEEGKNTLLITEALKKGNPSQKQTLKKLYGHGKISTKEMEELRKIFKDTGALDYSSSVALKYVDLAKKSAKFLTKDKKLVNLLDEMSDFLINRQK